jgi:hypothetical protein
MGFITDMVMMSISPASPDNKSIREIAEYVKKQDKQTQTMVRLTKSIMALTVVMALLIIIQLIKFS